MGWLLTLPERKHSWYAEEVSREMGFPFAAHATPEQRARFADLYFADRQTAGFPRNIMEGEVDGVPFVMMDLQDWHQSTRNSRLRDKTVVLFPELLLGLPNCALQPGWPRLIKALTMWLMRWTAPESVAANLDFAEAVCDSPPFDPSDITFARQYLLMGDLGRGVTDVSALRKVFTREVRVFFAEHPGWSVVLDKGRLSVWRGTSWCPARERPKLLSSAFAVYRLFVRPGQREGHLIAPQA